MTLVKLDFLVGAAKVLKERKQDTQEAASV